LTLVDKRLHGLISVRDASSGRDVAVRYNDTGDWYANYRVGEHTAATKILIDRATDEILGAHLLGPEYAELAHTLAVAMKLGLTTRQLKSATATYPTVGSDLGSML
jgi:glutathione reductase (NADPH)